MSSGLDKIESYLMGLGIAYEEIAPGSWIIEEAKRNLLGIRISHDGSVVTISAQVMKVPSKNRETFYAHLLKLNNTSLVHGAYGINNDAVILMDSLEYEGLDNNELQASLDALGYAIAEHYPILWKYQSKE